MISLTVSWIANYKPRLIAVIFFGLVFCVASNPLSGQVSSDTSSVVDSGEPYVKKNSFTSVFYGQPGKAALYSLILPGAGQLYNKRWWKVPLVWAGEGYLILNLSQNIRNTNKWQACRESFLDGTASSCTIGTSEITNNADAFEGQQDAKAKKELAWLFLIGGHLVQVFEAFVDRHLINFNTSEDLTSYHNQVPEFIELDLHNERPIEVFSLRIPLNKQYYSF